MPLPDEGPEVKTLRGLQELIGVGTARVQRGHCAGLRVTWPQSRLGL